MGAVRDVVERGALPVVLLGVALVACCLLAWQAYDSAASHRAASEAVLRDYAGLAAAELVRRAASEVGYQGHFVLVQALLEPGPGPRHLAADGDPRRRRAATLVRRTFRAELASRAVRFDDREDVEVASWLSQRLTPPRERDPFTVVQGSVAGQPRMFVLAAPRDGRIAGYEVELRAVSSFIEAAADRAALLPASLGRGRVGNARLAVVVRDAADREVYRRGSGWSGRLNVGLPFGDAYSGVLQGFRAEVEIDPAAAPDLVIGGPRGQVVAVTLEAANGAVRLAVEDEGLGIPPHERERIFQRFHRLERDRASAVTGTELGLAVVRALVTRQRGRCSVDSARGGGARIVVELPAAGEAVP